MMNWSNWAPVLNVSDIAASTKFYCDILGFQQNWSFEVDEDLGVSYASLSRGTLNLRLSQYTGTEQAELFISVVDVDSVYDDITSRGLTPEAPVSEDAIGVREFECEDPDGHRLIFASPI